MGDGTEPTRTTETAGIRVRKTIETGPDDTAVVTLEVTADRDDATTVRITEPALESISDDEIELHTDHGAAYWNGGEDAAFEREFDAGETYEIVYRVTDVTRARYESLDSDPVVTPVVSGVDEVVDRDRSDAVREVITGERESLTADAANGTDAERSVAAEESEQVDRPMDIEADDHGGADVPADGAEHAEPTTEPGPDDGAKPEDVPVDAAADSGDEPSSDAAAADEPAVQGDAVERKADDLDARLAATPAGAVTRVLLEELREGHVDDETLAELRSEIEPGQSYDLRIKHLESEVSEFEAYVEMLSSFVDDHGTFDEALGGVSEEVASLDERVHAVRGEVDDVQELVETEVDELATDVDALGDDQDALAARVDRLEDTLGSIEDRLDSFENRFDSFENRLESYENRLEEVDSFRERLSGALQNPGDDEQS